MTLRVLHVIPSYLPATRYGGPVFATHALCSALARQGCDVTVFTTSIDGDRDIPVKAGACVLLDGVRVRYFASPFLRRLYYAPAMARALRSEPAFDLVHTHSIFLWPMWAAARAARQRAIPYIVSPRGMLVRDLVRRRSTALKRAWIALVERSNIRHASALHVTSDVEAMEVRRFGLSLPPLFSIPNGVDRPVAQADVRIDPLFDTGEPIVLALGRIHWKKGLDRLIEAMRSVPRARLMIVGNDEDDYAGQLRRIAAQHGVAERVFIRGPAFGAEKEAIYRRSTMLALPSLSENFGNVVLEAMACGCPAVVTPQVGAASIVGELGGGAIAEGDAATFGAAMRSLLEDPSRLAAMRDGLAERVLGRYSWDAIASQMLEMYREVIARPR
jgi:glycosyltransferase involved in cell wall biosynthesis